MSDNTAFDSFFLSLSTSCPALLKKLYVETLIVVNHKEIIYQQYQVKNLDAVFKDNTNEESYRAIQVHLADRFKEMIEIWIDDVLVNIYNAQLKNSEKKEVNFILESLIKNCIYSFTDKEYELLADHFLKQYFENL